MRHGPRSRQDVVIGYCRPEMVDGAFFDAVTNIIFHDRDNDTRIYATIGVESGPRIAKARCSVVEMFLRLDKSIEWLCWLDCDMVPPADMIDRLLESANPTTHPIVGALCFAGGRTKIVPTIYTIGTAPDGNLESDTILAYPTPALIEVGGTGSACIIIHRSVFEKVRDAMEPGHPLPWYQEIVQDGKDWGEDLIFCLRARALADAHVWIDTGIKVGHRKKFTITEADFLRYAEQLDATQDGPDRLTDLTMPNIQVAPVLELADLSA